MRLGPSSHREGNRYPSFKRFMMARFFLLTFSLWFVFGSLTPAEAQSSHSIPVPTNARILAPKGRKCLNFLWDGPCDHPYCKVTLKIKLKKDANSVESEIPSSYKPAITSNNASFVQCIYDSSAGENASCCNSINSGAHLTSGYPLSFSNYYEKIGFHVKVCLNDTGNCASRPYWYDFVLPWHNPCFFDNPCPNSGTCNPGVDTYNCSCTSDWEGPNCTTLKGFTYHARKCLDYSSNADVKHYMNTLSRCKLFCTSMNSPSVCKSFEFKKMASGNHGNCTLRGSNSLEHKLVGCDADLYENEKYLTPGSGSGSTVAIATLHLLMMLLASIFVMEFQQ